MHIVDLYDKVSDQPIIRVREMGESESGQVVLEKNGPFLMHIYDCLCSYLIFVIFFTLAHFEASKFYTQKYVNLQQKLPRDNTA